MNQEKASVAMKAAIAASKDLNVKMNIAIVDAGGNLVSFNRMDGAWLGSIGKIIDLRCTRALIFMKI